MDLLVGWSLCFAEASNAEKALFALFDHTRLCVSPVVVCGLPWLGPVNRLKRLRSISSTFQGSPVGLTPQPHQAPISRPLRHNGRKYVEHDGFPAKTSKSTRYRIFSGKYLLLRGWCPSVLAHHQLCQQPPASEGSQGRWSQQGRNRESECFIPDGAVRDREAKTGLRGFQGQGPEQMKRARGN